jgi:hypothetical protein
MNQEVLHNKLKRTTYSYIEIHKKVHTNWFLYRDLYKPKSSLQGFKRNPRYIQKIHGNIQETLDAYTNKTKKETRKKATNLADLGRSSPDPADRCLVVVELVAGGVAASGWSGEAAASGWSAEAVTSGWSGEQAGRPTWSLWTVGMQVGHH